MIDREKVIGILNAARSMELRAISQYMAHHYQLDYANLPTLAKAVKEVAIMEMRHAEMLAERIRDLNGVPVTVPDGSVQDMDIMSGFQADAELENETQSKYQEYVNTLAPLDAVSEQLLKKIMMQEEGHLQFFDDVVAHMEDQNYWAAQMGGKYSALGYERFVVGK